MPSYVPEVKVCARQMIEQPEMPGYCIRECVVGHRVLKGNVQLCSIPNSYAFLIQYTMFFIVSPTCRDSYI